MEKQTLITPCGTFRAQFEEYGFDNVSNMFEALPKHKFGWSYDEFYTIYYNCFEFVGDDILIDLTK